MAVIVLALFHVLPIWVLYAALSTWGLLFTARLATDGMKKAKDVLSQLDDHKQNLNAHQGED